MAVSDKLTVLDVKNAKPRAKPYKLADGGGLYLEVMPNGSRYWRMKYRFAGKEGRLALGVFPEVSLKDARQKKLKLGNSYPLDLIHRMNAVSSNLPPSPLATTLLARLPKNGLRNKDRIGLKVTPQERSGYCKITSSLG